MQSYQCFRWIVTEAKPAKLGHKNLQHSLTELLSFEGLSLMKFGLFLDFLINKLLIILLSIGQ